MHQMTTARKNDECGDLKYLLNELSNFAPNLEIKELSIEECLYEQNTDQQYKTLSKHFGVNIAEVYLLTFNMYNFTDYKRGGVQRSNFNANLNGMLNFNRKTNSQAQTEAYLDSGENHWQLSMPCYAGKPYQLNQSNFLQKLSANIESLVTKTSNDILIVDLKSRKYLLHKTLENHRISTLLNEKFPLLKQPSTVKIVDIALKLECIKTLNLSYIDLGQCSLSTPFKNDWLSDLSLIRFILFRFDYDTPEDNIFRKSKLMLIDQETWQVYLLSEVIKTWLNDSIDETDLIRWFASRDLEQTIN